MLYDKKLTSLKDKIEAESLKEEKQLKVETKEAKKSKKPKKKSKKK